MVTGLSHGEQLKNVLHNVVSDTILAGSSFLIITKLVS
jgi:hypothetical protein